MKWKGVMPAITTCFDDEDRIDHAFMESHCRWLVDNGCSGIVALGSLGEGATLTFAEKESILRNCVKSLRGRAPVVAAISSLTTAEAVALAKSADNSGCDALMILPPYVYKGDWRESKAHVSALLNATSLSCMLYNNPVAYGTDYLPEQIRELAVEHPNLHSVKESSTDVRRVSAIRALLGHRLEVFIGVDDAILEGIAVGATGWIAGLANALPRESVDLFELGMKGKSERAFELYRWFLPLLRFDTVPKFVQLVKLAQQEFGIGNSRVRMPKLEIAGAELDATRKIIRQAIATRPKSASSAFRPRKK
jgi:1-pyrroline-4-hydroxy-2-carboxylate deaminase